MKSGNQSVSVASTWRRLSRCLAANGVYLLTCTKTHLWTKQAEDSPLDSTVSLKLTAATSPSAGVTVEPPRYHMQPCYSLCRCFFAKFPFCWLFVLFPVRSARPLNPPPVCSIPFNVRSPVCRSVWGGNAPPALDCSVHKFQRKRLG